MSNDTKRNESDLYVMPCRIIKSEGVLQEEELLNDTGIPAEIFGV